MGRTSDARDRLVAAAIELLEGGYQSTAVEDLCRRAGVKKGSFYYFFNSKQELAVAALQARWAAARRHLVIPILESDRPPLERIERFFEAVASASAHEKTSTGRCSGCFFGNLSAEMAGADRRIREAVGAIFEELAGYFARTLGQAVHTGAATGVDAAAAGRALVAFMEGLLLLAKTFNDPEMIRLLAGRAIGLVAAAPGAQDPHS